MNWMKWFVPAMVAAFLSACGGGGGSAGTSPFGSGSGTGTGVTPGTVAGASLTLAISSTTATAAAPSTVTATLLDATGAPISGQVINFSTVGGLGTFNVSTVLTDATGKAVVMLVPASASVNGADLVLGKVSVGTSSLSATVGFQVSPGSAPTTGAPSITLSLSSTSVTSTSSPTLTAVVKNAAGAVVPGQVVTFTTASTGIGAFSVASGLSDANGVVTTKINPASGTANGADTAIAQATVNGVLATGSIGFSVASTGNIGTPSISLTLSTNTVTTATPATVSATVKDATGAGVVGQVVRFSTVDGLGSFSVVSALTNTAGVASTTLSASTSTQSGADQVVAATTVNGTALQASQGFQLTAASTTIASVTADTPSLGAYAQTGVLVTLAGSVPGTPVLVAITSSCIASGKAVLTPPTATTTNGVASFTYRDNGCGATTTTDTLRASIAGSASTGSLALTISSPVANSINFVSATPTSIYLKGSGYTETSTVIFKVLDTAGNGLPNQVVQLRPTTSAGGLTLDNVVYSNPASFEPKTSDSNGQVSVLINSGTVPTPVRIIATLAASTNITTVSSSLSIAVGLPSQLNFSLSQGTRNIEGFDIDGTKNTYNIIASDRLGNPVPAGTSINFVSEGGQVVQSALTTIDASGNARATANFLSSSPRPADGRVTVLAYALGEESFIDLNGNNVWDPGEPFQDLGNIYLDRYYNGVYNPNDDQFISTSLSSGTAACAAIPAAYQPLLNLDVSIPSIPATCDGTWGKAYVRRAIETVFSTSSARPLWYGVPANLYSVNGASCPRVSLTIGYGSNEAPIPASFLSFGAGGTALYNATGSYSFLVADANGVRLNPMAAGSTISIAGTTGLTVQLLGGSPVPSTTEASFATFSVSFANGIASGTVTLSFTSPGGLTTSVPFAVNAGAPPGSATACM